MSRFGNDTVTLHLDDLFVELTYKNIVDLLKTCCTVSTWATLRLLASTLNTSLAHIIENRHIQPRMLSQIGALTLQQITTITSDILVFKSKASQGVDDIAALSAQCILHALC